MSDANSQVQHIDLSGTDTDDLLLGSDQDDQINSGSGHDAIYGFDGDDTLLAEDGDFLFLDEVHVAVAVVVHTHRINPLT